MTADRQAPVTEAGWAKAVAESLRERGTPDIVVDEFTKRIVMYLRKTGLTRLVRSPDLVARICLATSAAFRDAYQLGVLAEKENLEKRR